MSDFSQFFDAEFGIDYAEGQGNSLFDTEVSDPLFEEAPWAKKEEEFEQPPASQSSTPQVPSAPAQGTPSQPQAPPPGNVGAPGPFRGIPQATTPQTPHTPITPQMGMPTQMVPPSQPLQQAPSRRNTRKPPGRIQIRRQTVSGTPQPQQAQYYPNMPQGGMPSGPGPVPNMPPGVQNGPATGVPPGMAPSGPNMGINPLAPQMPPAGPPPPHTQQGRAQQAHAQAQAMGPHAYQQFMRQQQQQQQQQNPHAWRRPSVGQSPRTAAAESHTPQMSPAQVQMQIQQRQYAAPRMRKPGQPAPAPSGAMGVPSSVSGSVVPGAPGAAPASGTPQQQHVQLGQPPRGMPMPRSAQGQQPMGRPMQPRPEDIRLSFIALLYYMVTLRLAPEAQSLLQKVDQIPIDQMVGLFKQMIVKTPQEVPLSARIPMTDLPQDRFLSVLHEFMQTRGTPVYPHPNIGGKRLSIHVIFMAAQSLGSFLGIIKGFRWPQFLQSLSLPYQSDIALEVIQTYYRLLLPFEEAFNSNSQIRAHLLEKRQSMSDVSPQVSHQTPQAVPPQQQQQQAVAAAQTAAARQRAQAVHAQQTQQAQQVQTLSARQHTPQMTPAQLQAAQAQTAAARQRVQAQAAAQQQAQAAAQAQAQQALAAQRRPVKREASEKPRAGPPPKRPSLQPERPPSASAAAARLQRDNFKLLCEDEKYLLQRRHLTTYGGHDMRKIMHLGSEIENWRPYVAFPLDLGSVDLHAITMSLASRCPADVRQALDKLVVVTADPRVHISLQHSPHLFANLSKVTEDVLNIILEKGPNDIRQVHTKIETEPLKVDPESVGDHLFERISRKKPDSKDITIVVDASSGQEVGSSESTSLEDIGDVIGDIKQSLQHEHELRRQKEAAFQRKLEGKPKLISTEEKQHNAEMLRKRSKQPFDFLYYTRRYELVEREFQELKEPEDEKVEFFRTAACNRLLAGTCVIRNLSFAESNKPLIAKKPQFQKLLWNLLFSLAENNCLLDSHLRTLDLSKDLLVVLSNIALHLVLDDPKNALVLILFLLSFSVQETPFLDDGTIEFVECDTEVHRYLSNAIDIFAKLIPRDRSHLNLIENVLKDTITDPDYRVLIDRFVGPRGKLQPCELLTRFFAMTVSVLPYPHIKLSLDPRGQIIWQASLGTQMLVDMIPDDNDQPEDAPTPWKGYNVAQRWLNSQDRFGTRVLRTIKFMGMVVVPPQPQNGTPSVQGDLVSNDPNAMLANDSSAPKAPNNLRGEKTRPFSQITQRVINIMRKLYTKAVKSPEFSKIGIFPTVEQVLGGLFATEMDKFVVRHLEYLYFEGQKAES